MDFFRYGGGSRYITISATKKDDSFVFLAVALGYRNVFYIDPPPTTVSLELVASLQSRSPFQVVV
jgi:hypothetical protein